MVGTHAPPPYPEEDAFIGPRCEVALQEPPVEFFVTLLDPPVTAATAVTQCGRSLSLVRVWSPVIERDDWVCWEGPWPASGRVWRIRRVWGGAFTAVGKVDPCTLESAERSALGFFRTDARA